jgi:phage repressor protein C with HTH and peptisase S24 domain
MSYLDNNDAVQNRLKELRKLARTGRPKGYKLRELADFLETTESVVSKIERGEIPLSERWLRGFAEFYGVAVAELLPDGRQGASARTARLVGYVGAGEMYYPDPEAGPWEGFDEVEAPPGAGEVVAVRVKGLSMAPVYRDGDLLYFSREHTDLEACMNRDCVIQVRNGPAYVKRLERDQKGRLRLVSYGELAPIDNPDVEWAAPVKWVMRK